MKKILTLILLLCFCTELLLASCEKNMVESEETTIKIPGVNDTTLTLANVYPMYFKPMSGDHKVEPYWFYFKEGGSVTCDKNFSLYTPSYIDREYTREELLFDSEQSFIPETGKEYFAFGYTDGRISYEYENNPVVALGFFVISEEEYKIMLEEKYKYGENYSINNLKIK